MKVIHIVEKFFNSGALSCMNQINKALQLSEFIKNQEIICVKNNSNKKEFNIPRYFPQNTKVFNSTEILDYLKNQNLNSTVCIFHKLMCSPTKVISSLLHQSDMPSIVINHTYSKSINFNKLYKFDACIAVSDHMKYELEKINPKMKVFTIKNIVDFNSVSAYPTHVRDSNFYITGRINALNVIKYNDDFVKWISTLKFSKPHLHQYIGTGQFINQANELSYQLRNNNSNTQFLGSILDEEKKIGILKSWDLFLYEINRPEGTSMSVLESLACGVPVICNNYPGNNEIIKDGINGYVFDNFKQAEDLLKNILEDEDYLKSLKNSTLEWAKENLSSSILMNKYEEVIKWVLKNHKYKKSIHPVDHAKNDNKENVENNVIKNRFHKKRDESLYNGKAVRVDRNINYNKHISKIGRTTNSGIKQQNSVIDECVKMYLPSFAASGIHSVKKINSDYFVVYCMGDFDLGISSALLKNANKIIYDVIDNKVKNFDLNDKVSLKKTEILISSSEELDNIKNFILNNCTWEEKEK